MRKMRKIESIRGLKVIMILALFWWHSWLKNPNFDVGARTCELLFLISGFLISYNHYEKGMDTTWIKSIDYTKNKVIQMWPLHFIAFLISILASEVPMFTDKIEWVYAALNLSFLQAWFSNGKIFFSFNGASWFLSSLLFCYFITPLLLYLLKKKRAVYYILPIVIAIRLFVEFMQIKEPGGFYYSVHVNPLIRAMEYFIGMMAGEIFLKVRDCCQGKMKKRRFVMLSMGEIFAFIGYIWLAYRFEGIWMRGIYVLLGCILIFIFAFDGGVISKLLGCGLLKKIGTIQFEFYILHQPIINLIQKYLKDIVVNEWIRASIAFLVICVLGYLYQKYLKRIMSNLMNYIFTKIENVILAVE